MSFPTYSAYRESGIEWLQYVPTHWQVGSVRWLCRRYSGGTPDREREEFWKAGTIPWINSGSVNDWLIERPSTYITEAGLLGSSAKWIPKGALVMALAGQGKTKGMVAQVAFDVTCNQSMVALVPGAEIEPRFLLWWLHANYQNIRNMAGGDQRDGLNLELVGNIQCPLPTKVEQTRIIDFLDHETAAINSLIIEQARLIDLLHEKRQAVISHAVRKGLNTEAPMKPSGVESLGDVPAHWSHSLKIVDTALPVRSAFVNGPFGSDLLTSELTDEGVPVIYIRDLKPSGYSRVSTVCVTQEKATELAFCDVRPGDVLIAKVGEPPGIAVVYPSGEPVGVVTQDVIRLRADQDIALAEFLVFWLNSMTGRAAIDLISVESTRTRIGLGDLKQIRLSLPPLNEQKEIVGVLNESVCELDRLSAEARRATSLLHERRAALISAAVTGQIDVRGIVEQEAA